MILNFAEIAIESAGLAAGGTASMLLTKELPKMVPSLNSKYIPFVNLAIGALAPRLIGKKNDLILNVGRGLVARAGSDIMANALGLVSGIGEVQYVMIPQPEAAVAGTPEEATI